MKYPVVSVIMPVYNSADFIKEAIESILNQTFSDFEMIVIDDCSTDNSAEIICSIQDERLVFLKNDVNLGVAKTLNRGIEVAKGKYIARMDADDVSLPDRFDKQVSFFEAHPDYILCGGFAVTYDGESQFVYPSVDNYLRPLLLFQNVFVHPNVMFRADALKKLKYDEGFNFCEDYDLWFRCSRMGKIMVLPHILLRYRVHAGSVTFQKQKRMNDLRRVVQERELALLGIFPTEEEYQIHEKIARIYSLKNELKATYLIDLENWLDKLMYIHSQKPVYKRSDLNAVVFYRWLLSCHFLGKPAWIASRKILSHLTPLSFFKVLHLLFLKYVYENKKYS